ncbi:MAG: YfaZ family outer membrane protein [Sulfuricurvum sp.]|uniref:YfaZ family outer membrane protein n=1 Tax=Sulfuricurvum sp. TaxID=2025608 RepID=UPI00272855F8|nr:YfaZ family outer membrane protein [Sulfuricurvum sp.]MDO9055810.1 YfaZ family outer membrane protein [Sulfuricurvum sp.]MDP2850523.1 YfaZ family outer membrane protein [Sulfuricurvum sp.]MDP3292586.1 YfaZ family outer membrane protein [Sulfuricurvum sp.]
MLKILLLGTLISTAAFAAHQAELNVNNKELEGQIRIDMKQMSISSLEGSYLGARILNGDESNSDRIGNTDPLMEVSFMVQRPVAEVPGLAIGLGLKGEYTKFDGQHYSAIPLGIEADMKLPIEASIPFYVGGALYYAPSVLAFQDADAYFETRIHFDVEPIKNGRIEVGYRMIDTDVKSRDVTYNDAWYLGMRIDF